MQAVIWPRSQSDALLTTSNARPLNLQHNTNCAQARQLSLSRAVLPVPPINLLAVSLWLQPCRPWSGGGLQINDPKPESCRA
jgi:hypothetical protein